LEDLSGIDRVLKVVEDVIVKVDGKEDSTDNRRWMMADSSVPWNKPGRKMFRKLENRVHRRLVLQPLGVPVVCFSSKRELISVLIDIVQSEQVSMVNTYFVYLMSRFSSSQTCQR